MHISKEKTRCRHSRAPLPQQTCCSTFTLYSYHHKYKYVNLCVRAASAKCKCKYFKKKSNSIFSFYKKLTTKICVWNKNVSKNAVADQRLIFVFLNNKSISTINFCSEKKFKKFRAMNDTAFQAHTHTNALRHFSRDTHTQTSYIYYWVEIEKNNNNRNKLKSSLCTRSASTYYNSKHWRGGGRDWRRTENG